MLYSALRTSQRNTSGCRRFLNKGLFLLIMYSVMYDICWYDKKHSFNYTFHIVRYLNVRFSAFVSKIWPRILVTSVNKHFAHHFHFFIISWEVSGMVLYSFNPFQFNGDDQLLTQRYWNDKEQFNNCPNYSYVRVACVLNAPRAYSCRPISFNF